MLAQPIAEYVGAALHPPASLARHSLCTGRSLDTRWSPGASFTVTVSELPPSAAQPSGVVAAQWTPLFLYSAQHVDCTFGFLFRFSFPFLTYHAV